MALCMLLRRIGVNKSLRRLDIWLRSTTARRCAAVVIGYR